MQIPSSKVMQIRRLYYEFTKSSSACTVKGTLGRATNLPNFENATLEEFSAMTTINSLE